MKLSRSAILLLSVAMSAAAQDAPNPYVTLMQRASTHARSTGSKFVPVLSPVDNSVLSTDGCQECARGGTAGDGRACDPMDHERPGEDAGGHSHWVDGLISDRPDLLQKVLAEERASATPEVRARLAHFDVAGHRGGRGLRPENTLPSFESGMDQGIDTIETDTGVTTDHVSLIWHDQFLNPQSCRRADGSPYTLENRVYIRDISMAEAQSTFICDKLHFGPDQKNDLALSPVSVAFARQEKLMSPYVPTNAEQLFRFCQVLCGVLSHRPRQKRIRRPPRGAHTAETVKFNLETKILPDRLPPAVAGKQDVNVPPEMFQNHTVSAQVFVDTLCGAILRNHMQSRADVQSFDFRTLILIEEQHPEIQTFYLTDNVNILASDFVPASLRETPLPAESLEVRLSYSASSFWLDAGCEVGSVFSAEDFGFHALRMTAAGLTASVGCKISVGGAATIGSFFAAEGRHTLRFVCNSSLPEGAPTPSAVLASDSSTGTARSSSLGSVDAAIGA